MNRTIALVFKAALGAGLALGFTAAPHGDAHADDTTVIFEDDPRWSCVDDGNKVCGPGNAQGVPAGRYDEAACLSIRGQSTPTPTWTATGDPPTEPCESASRGA